MLKKINHVGDACDEFHDKINKANVNPSLKETYLISMLVEFYPI